jgi:hypothetical protein
VLTPDFGTSGSVSYGTFDLRDLTPANDGLLISSVALDMTMGYNATQPCVECCGYLADSPTFDPYPAEVVVDGIEQTGIEAVSGCSDDTSYISSYYATWGSLNPSIAAVTANQVQGVAAGTTTGTAAGTIPTPGSCVRALYSSRSQVPVAVNPTVTISCDLTDMAIGTFAGTGTCYTSGVTPEGGTFTWETGSTEISLSCTNNACSNSVDYTAKTPSKAEDDVTITVTYTYNGQSADDASDPITIHQPTALRTNSSNPATTTCTLPCLANPGTCAVKSGSSCSFSAPETQRNYSVLDQFGNPFEEVNLGAAPVITEQVNQQSTTCGAISLTTGNTSASPFSDTLYQCASCCEAGGPGCTSTYSQILYSNGVSVRQESISTTCTAVTPAP